MFHVPKNSGWLEIIVGPMFSGKTEELIKRLRRAIYAKQKVIVFKPSQDNRFSESDIVSRNQMKFESIAIKNPSVMLELAEDKEVVGIDEVQFFEPTVIQIAEKLADAGKRVIIAGLDLDFRAEPFENVATLMAKAEYVTKTLAICVVCGNPASRSQRIKTHLSENNDSRILVGDTEYYEARCRKCFKPYPVYKPDSENIFESND